MHRARDFCLNPEPKQQVPGPACNEICMLVNSCNFYSLYPQLSLQEKFYFVIVFDFDSRIRQKHFAKLRLNCHILVFIRAEIVADKTCQHSLKDTHSTSARLHFDKDVLLSFLEHVVLQILGQYDFHEYHLLLYARSHLSRSRALSRLGPAYKMHKVLVNSIDEDSFHPEHFHQRKLNLASVANPALG